MTNLQEQIEKYHLGQMSESELASFEKQLNSDPSLKAESDLQADIINGLKGHRKLELKSRMDAINVGPTWVEFIGQSALMKSMGGVIVASVIGTGIYFLGERDESITNSNPIEISAPTPASEEYVWELGQDEAVNAENSLEKPELKPQTTDSKNIDNTQLVEVSSPDQEEVQVAKENGDVFKPSVDAPQVDDIEEETKFKASNLDELPETVETAESEEPIDVETQNSRSNIIKYKYFDGKLFLNGDFDKAPYEILEINSASGRRIYVYYLGTYYQVGTTDKLIELPAVKDQDVIKELKLIRENK
ncbi:hypothetical protein [Ekhidna sp.]|uniref:hypothetical protein n=1 Tax=Ekhidna sp. TaxID=2608089 RepID=UPI003B50DEFE